MCRITQAIVIFFSPFGSFRSDEKKPRTTARLGVRPTGASAWQARTRKQVALLPECVDDYIGGDIPVRVIDAFVDELDLAELDFNGIKPATTGRPSYHPGVMLKIYIYGYLNRIPSSRRLERECQRNVELMWLTGRLAPDFKTIADFRRDSGTAIRNTCRRFVELCRGLKLLTSDMVAIDDSTFKASNSRDLNFFTCMRVPRS